MPTNAVIKLEDKELNYPIMIGSEGEKAIDLRSLRSDTGYITYDEGYGNTGSCESSITYIDGEKGILRYRGYPIDQLAERSDFIETAASCSARTRRSTSGWSTCSRATRATPTPWRCWAR